MNKPQFLTLLFSSADSFQILESLLSLIGTWLKNLLQSFKKHVNLCLLLRVCFNLTLWIEYYDIFFGVCILLKIQNTTHCNLIKFSCHCHCLELFLLWTHWGVACTVEVAVVNYYSSVLFCFYWHLMWLNWNVERTTERSLVDRCRSYTLFLQFFLIKICKLFVWVTDAAQTFFWWQWQNLKVLIAFVHSI